MAYKVKKRKRKETDYDGVEDASPSNKKENGVSTESSGFSKFDRDF